MSVNLGLLRSQNSAKHCTLSRGDLQIVHMRGCLVSLTLGTEDE